MTHVIQIWGTLVLEVLNLKARSLISKPSLNLIIAIKNSCSNVSFLSGPRLLTGMTTLWYLGHCSLILVCRVLKSFDLWCSFLTFPISHNYFPWFDMAEYSFKCGSGLKTSKKFDIILSSKLFKPKKVLVKK